jgi:hypothetical protein
MKDYVARASDLMERGAQASTEIAAKWRARSLADGDWTVDTVTADLIEATDHLTPLFGESLELWLELLQRTLASGARRGG